LELFPFFLFSLQLPAGTKFLSIKRINIFYPDRIV
jgi:hypothetical protein